MSVFGLFVHFCGVCVYECVCVCVCMCALAGALVLFLHPAYYVGNYFVFEIKEILVLSY